MMMRSFYTSFLLLLLFLITVSCFITTSPSSSSRYSSKHVPPGRSRPAAAILNSLRRRGRAPCFALQFIADADEKEGVGKRKDDNEEQEEDGWKSAWIPTSNGGFLPNLDGNRNKKPCRPKNEVLEVLSLNEYKQQVAEEKDRLVCVRFYAPWCRACKAIEKPFRQLAKLYPTVKFVQVPLTKDTGVLHQGLGITSLPFAHIYHPAAGLVEEARISRKHFQHFRNHILQSYVDGECPVQFSDDGTENMPTGGSTS